MVKELITETTIKPDKDYFYFVSGDPLCIYRTLRANQKKEFDPKTEYL
jgi:hypothetical protein